MLLIYLELGELDKKNKDNGLLILLAVKDKSMESRGWTWT